MPSEHHVVAPYAIEDPDLECVVYSPGAIVPYDDAVKYGLIKPEMAEPKRAERKSADRAKKPQRNAAKSPDKDR